MEAEWLLSITVLVAYVSLIIELAVFPVPSEASVYQLCGSKEVSAREGSAKIQPDDALHRARSMPMWKKLIVFLGPTALGVVSFLIPLVVVVVGLLSGGVMPLRAQTLTWLGPIEAPLGIWLWWVAAATILAGRVLTFGAMLRIRRIHRGEAVSQGVFNYSRNPGLLGMYLFYLGNVFFFPCFFLALVFPLYVWNMHQRVLMEEAHLRRQLGSAWDSYAGKVSRYIPWMRSSA